MAGLAGPLAGRGLVLGIIIIQTSGKAGSAAVIAQLRIVSWLFLA